MTDEGITDPRELGGSVTGPDDHHARGEFVVDARRAILQDYFEVVHIDEWSKRQGEPVIGCLVAGRINQSQDRANVLFIGNLDMVAALITELHGIAERMGAGEALTALVKERWAKMPT